MAPPERPGGGTAGSRRTGQPRRKNPEAEEPEAGGKSSPAGRARKRKSRKQAERAAPPEEPRSGRAGSRRRNSREEKTDTAESPTTYPSLLFQRASRAAFPPAGTGIAGRIGTSGMKRCGSPRGSVPASPCCVRRLRTERSSGIKMHERKKKRPRIIQSPQDQRPSGGIIFRSHSTCIDSAKKVNRLTRRFLQQYFS